MPRAAPHHISLPAAIRRKKTSKYRGVCVRDGRYIASLGVRGKTVLGGQWGRERDAALAADRLVLYFELELERGLNLPYASMKLGPASPEQLRQLARAKSKVEFCASRYFGVRRHKQSRRWTASAPGVHTPFARFRTELEAAEAYDRCARKAGVDRGWLNFPDRELSPATAEEICAEIEQAKQTRRTARLPGARWDPQQGKWAATVNKDGQRQVLAHFERVEDAARCHDAALAVVTAHKSRQRKKAPKEAATRTKKKAAESKVITKRQKQPPANKPVGAPSSYRGVALQPNGQYMAKISHAGKRIYLGLWRDEKDAALAYDRAGLWFEVERSRLNFPGKARQLVPTEPEALRREARLRERQHRGADSRYFGVIFSARSKKWDAMIAIDGKQVVVASFQDAKDAAVARDRVWLHHGRDPNLLNFPDERLTPASVEQIRREARESFKETTSSQYRGVIWVEERRRFMAMLRVGDHVYHLGSYEDEREAALAHDRAARRLRGEQAQLNFPAPESTAVGRRSLRQV